METNLSKEISKELTVKNPLWTRDFTIITIGSVVSMLGNNMAGFAMSLMVMILPDQPCSMPYTL